MKSLPQSDPGILNEHKNELLRILKEIGFERDAFNVEDKKDDDKYYFVVQHLQTGFKFVIVRSSNNFNKYSSNFTRFVPGFRDRGRIGNQSINSVYSDFEDWLSNELGEYVRHLEVPNLWEQISRQEKLVQTGLPDDSDIESYTDEEKRQIRLSLNDFRQLIVETFAPNEDQLEIISQRLDYLSGALDRVNRFDWRSLALSALVSISVNLTLDTESGNRLFELFKQAFSSVIRLIGSS